MSNALGEWLRDDDWPLADQPPGGTGPRELQNSRALGVFHHDKGTLGGKAAHPEEIPALVGSTRAWRTEGKDKTVTFEASRKRGGKRAAVDEHPAFLTATKRRFGEARTQGRFVEADFLLMRRTQFRRRRAASRWRRRATTESEQENRENVLHVEAWKSPTGAKLSDRPGETSDESQLGHSPQPVCYSAGLGVAVPAVEVFEQEPVVALRVAARQAIESRFAGIGAVAHVAHAVA